MIGRQYPDVVEVVVVLVVVVVEKIVDVGAEVVVEVEG
jgi:hypothetical protein